MNGELKVSVGYMLFASIMAIVLGAVMLLYPGGTMALMATAFWVLQAIISVYILVSAAAEAARNFKAGSKFYGVIYILIGALAALFVWIFNVTIIYFVIAAFFIITGVAEMVGSKNFPGGKFFVIFLGLLNVIIGLIMLKNPVILPLLIAWYVLFWGISRLFLALEVRKVFAAS